MIGHFSGFIKQLERGTQFEYEQPGSLGKAWPDETRQIWLRGRQTTVSVKTAGTLLRLLVQSMLM